MTLGRRLPEGTVAKAFGQKIMRLYFGMRAFYVIFAKFL
jgi:hypothetical protein